MGGLPPPECPHCGVVHDRWDSTASHMAQKGDSEHPEETHSDGVKTLESEYEIRKTAAGWEPTEPAEEGGTPSSDGTDESDEPNPLLDVPEHRSEGRPMCPECGDGMRRAGEGVHYRVRFDGEKQHAETERGDYVCDDCRVLKPDGDDALTIIGEA
jgi:hypothetical protein